MSQSWPALHGPEPGFPSCYLPSLCPSHAHSMASHAHGFWHAVPQAHLWLIINQWLITICHRTDYLNCRRPRQVYPCSWIHITPATAPPSYSRATLLHAKPALSPGPPLALAPSLAVARNLLFSLPFFLLATASFLFPLDLSAPVPSQAP